MAKRASNQPRRPPPVYGNLPLGKYHRFFDASDVNSLSKQVGFRLDPQLKPSALAERWAEAFHVAAFHGAFVEGYPAAPSTRREYHVGVLTAAQALWDGLGIPGDLLASDYALDPRKGGEHWSENLFDIVGLGDAARFDFVSETLAVAPRVIALLAGLSNASVDALQKLPPSPGRRPNHFSRRLYQELAKEYEYAFGHRPETGRERDQPNCASSIWIDGLLRLAAVRVPERILLDVQNESERMERVRHHPLVLAVREAAAQAFITKADALAEGWKELLQNPGNSSNNE